MKAHLRAAVLSCVCLVTLLIGSAGCKCPCLHRASSFEQIVSESQTPLDRYVAAPDTNYSFHLVKTIPGDGFKTYVLEMTSQAWLTTNEVDRPLWKHWVIIVRPDEVKGPKSLLFITGGKNGSNPPEKPDANLAKIATTTHTVVSELKMIPNQPLVFAGETEGRVEDSLIAYTWDKFLRTGDPKWPARLPMTKAAVRAMDAITSFCGTSDVGGPQLSQFVVSGGSKRGWTTWTTAAVDKRVIAIVPAVIDLLNIEPSMLHHYGAYGFWAPSIGDYSLFRIMDWNGTPEYHALMKIVEPYQYRSRLTMPKLILNASGDQFFLPDSSQFYFKDLPGANYIRYVPNADHSLKGTDAYESVLAFYNSILNGIPLPAISWKVLPNGSIEATTTSKPTVVKLWQATNPDARDFRLETLGPKYVSSTLTPSPEGHYLASVPKPAKGWTAFFIEFTFPSSTIVPLKLTTEVHVVPDVLPYKFVPNKPTK
jgi:PhoPQ-activated pathogenicity-related protein